MSIYVVLAALLSGAAASAWSQASTFERRHWVDPVLTNTTDDPRRMPMASRDDKAIQTIVLRGARVFDGTGTPARAATVVIFGNRIAGVYPADEKAVPGKARVIDASGMTVMPGLIDLHAHLSHSFDGDSPGRAADPVDATLRGAERLRYFIESGITSVRDASSIENVAIRLKKWVAQGRVIGPRVFAAGRGIAATGGHSREGQGEHELAIGAAANGPEEWRAAVRLQFDYGADVIKLFSHFTREEVQAAVDEAHDLGLRVMVDAETFYIQRAVEAGADDIEHPLPRTDATIQLMAKRGTFAVPTLVPYIYLFNDRGGYWGTASRRFTFSKEANLDVVRRMRRAGIKMGIGTDLVGDWYRLLPAPYITELKQFVVAGYSNTEALRAATAVNAEILDMSDKLGTLQAGKLADVLIVRGAPDQRLDDLANVVTVIRDGVVVVEHGELRVPRHASLPEALPYTRVP